MCVYMTLLTQKLKFDPFFYKSGQIVITIMWKYDPYYCNSIYWNIWPSKLEIWPQSKFAWKMTPVFFRAVTYQIYSINPIWSNGKYFEFGSHNIFFGTSPTTKCVTWGVIFGLIFAPILIALRINVSRFSFGMFVIQISHPNNASEIRQHRALFSFVGNWFLALERK